MSAAELFHGIEATQQLAAVLYAKVAKVDFLQSNLLGAPGQSSEAEAIAPHFARADNGPPLPSGRFRTIVIR
jgi:hypothetical protein